MGLAGYSDPRGRDLTVDAMNAVAIRLNRRYQTEVSVVRYQDGPFSIVDGLMAGTGPLTAEGWMGPTLYVPVRRRVQVGRRAGRWREVQTVAAAAAQIAAAVPRR